MAAASTIRRASTAFIAIGFSTSTGFLYFTASSTSARWIASGEATKIASTSGQAQSSAAEKAFVLE